MTIFDPIFIDPRKFIYTLSGDGLEDEVTFTARGRGLGYGADGLPDGTGRVFDIEVEAPGAAFRYVASRPIDAPPGSAEPIVALMTEPGAVRLTELLELTETLLSLRPDPQGGTAFVLDGAAPGTVHGTRGDDVMLSLEPTRAGGMIGGAGDDILFAAGGGRLQGGAGEDFVYLGARGQAFGGRGDDIVIVDGGGTLRGGAGTDTLINLGGTAVKFRDGEVMYSAGTGRNFVLSGEGTLVLDEGQDALTKFNDFDSGADKLWLRSADGTSMSQADAFDFVMSNGRMAHDGWRADFGGHMIVIDVDNASEITIDGFLGSDTDLPVIEFTDRLHEIAGAGAALETALAELFVLA